MSDRQLRRAAARNLAVLKKQARKERADIAREALEQTVVVPALGDVIYSMADEPIYAMVGFVHNDHLQLCMVARFGEIEAPMFVLPLAQIRWEPTPPDRSPVEHGGRWRLVSTSRVVSDVPQGGLVVVPS